MTSKNIVDLINRLASVKADASSVYTTAEVNSLTNANRELIEANTQTDITNYASLDSRLNALDTDNTSNKERLTALSNELSDYLPLAGGNVTGNLTVQNKNLVRTINDVEADVNGNVVIESGTSYEIGQIINSLIPLTNAMLHPTDGAVISGSGSYAEFVTLMAGKVSTNPELFCTESEWQTSNTNYGFCGKFVYDDVANTVRLPKVNSEHGALIKSYSSGSDWYRIYQDGFCEQGGVGLSGVNNPISYHIAYINKPFVQMSPLNQFSSYLNANLGNAISTSASSFIITLNSADSGYGISSPANNIQCAWFACGYVDISDLQIAPIYEYIVLGTVTKTDIQIDIDNVLSDLANKADKDLSNVTAPTQAFKDMSIEWGQPDYTSAIAITLTLNTPVSYIAPSDGFINYTLTGLGRILAFIQVNGHDVCYFQSTSGNYSVTSSGIVPVHEGDNISIQQAGGDSSYLIRSLGYAEFVPCKGV